MDTPTAAGSLFTSCVTNTEPQGIKDLREAKAGYLDALANLRAADAEKVKAEATLVQAQAATEQARAALVQAAAKAKEIENDFNAAENAIALDTAKAAAEVYLAQKEKELAEAEEALRAYLVKVEEQSKQLTWAEQQIVWSYTQAYNKVVDKQKAVREKEADLYKATYNYAGVSSVEAAQAGYEADKARAEQSKAFFEAAIAAHQELTEAQIANYEEWVEKYDALQAEIAGFEYDKAQIAKDSALNEYENAEALAAFYKEIKAKRTAIGNANKGFAFAKFEKELPVVSFKVGSVVETFVQYAKIKTVSFTEDNKKMIVAKADGDAGKKAVKNVVDSLNLIIDALNREKVVVDQIVKDTTGIGALLAKTTKEYNDTKKYLEAGIDKYDEVLNAKAKVDSLTEVIEKETTAFNGKKDAFISSAKDFVEAWNTFADKAPSKLKEADSEKVFNAFVEVMKQRENIFPGPFKGDTLKYTYYKRVVKEDGDQPVWEYKADTLKFTELKFKDIRQYRFINADGDAEEDVISHIFAKGFGVETFTSFEPETDEIKFEDFVVNTDFFQKTFFNTYWLHIKIAANPKGDGKMYKTRDAENAYLGEAVAKAEGEKTKAVEGIETAKNNYKTNVYEKFWGVPFPEKQEDSLKINFTEKTYTDPTILVTFSGKEGETVFTPAKDKKDAVITWANVNYNDSSVALKAIEKQLNQNNIKINETADYTLYAKTLAVAQFASAAVNYKENTQALAELTTIVKAVETAFNDAVAAADAGSTLADSLKVKYLGKDKKYYGNLDYTVDTTTNKGNITKFITVDGKGTFNLAGEQKELAEKYLTDYAKTYSELEKQKKDIEATIKDNNNLSKIYEDYVKALADIEDIKGVDTEDPDEVYEAIKTKFDGVNALIMKLIEVCEYNIEEAEGNLAKLEAGYDDVQIAIEAAQDALAKAQQALEQAEVEFAAAEAAYKAVLEAHGITE